MHWRADQGYYPEKHTGCFRMLKIEEIEKLKNVTALNTCVLQNPNIEI